MIGVLGCVALAVLGYQIGTFAGLALVGVSALLLGLVIQLTEWSAPAVGSGRGSGYGAWCAPRSGGGGAGGGWGRHGGGDGDGGGGDGGS